MRRKISVKGVDEDAFLLLAELREAERRFAGAVLSDAIRYYADLVFDGQDVALEPTEVLG